MFSLVQFLLITFLVFELSDAFHLRASRTFVENRGNDAIDSKSEDDGDLSKMELKSGYDDDDYSNDDDYIDDDDKPIPLTINDSSRHKHKKPRKVIVNNYSITVIGDGNLEKEKFQVIAKKIQNAIEKLN